MHLVYKHNSFSNWAATEVSHNFHYFAIVAGYRDRFLSFSTSVADKLSTRALLRGYQPEVLLPFYHAISDEPLPHIRQLYAIRSVREFREDLDFLLRFFEPIDYAQFAALQQSGEKTKKPAFLLSFDDGLREVWEVIAPILAEKGVPAMVFCNSAFLDNKDLFYRYKVSLLLEKAAQSHSAHQQLVAGFSESGTLRQHLLSLGHEHIGLIDSLATSIEVDFSDFLRKYQPYLKHDQVENLLHAGHHIGGHSIDHPVYEKLSVAEQLRQTRTSIDYLQQHFGLDYRIFSFPFTDYGVSRQFFNQLAQENIADHTFGCAGIKLDSVAKNHQRVALEVGNRSARQIVNAELLYAMLKSVLGKNRIKRHD